MAGVGLAACTVVAAACANRGAQPDDAAGEPPTTADVGILEPASAIHLRGRITDDSITIEPVLEFRGQAPTTTTDGGALRLRGVDDAGMTLFDVRFEGTPVADLPSGPEEHFDLVVGAGPAVALRLAEVELIAGDGRRALRSARLSRTALTASLRADRALRLARIDGGRVRLTWDADLFPLVTVLDPLTGRVLAMGRDGGVTVNVTGDAIHVMVSEGVRSATGRVQVP